eukprot:TRINITY_DN1024_c0_g1_i1.p2 TRINITY_DN1024_c0_g1~~TRINITY_DN1024_c0_g1_i1.p2  ORF type:complete len:217 (-),score=63.99 TRINITY_DN1024_c0_g1_i1:137-787(-)
MHEYKPYKVDIEKNPQLASLIRQSHFALGDSTENPYTSVYENTYRPFDLKDAYVSPAPNKNFVSSFDIGLNDQNLHMTEAQRMFRKPPAEAYKVDSDLKASIRFIKGSHFDLGGDKSDGAKHFVTLNEQTYQHRPAEMAVPYKGVQADLRKSHFEIGNAQEPMLTTSQCAYTDKSKESDNKRAKPMALRQSHFTLGDGKGQYTTTHLLNYRDPKLL